MSPPPPHVYESSANLGPEVPVLFHIVCSENPLPPITIRRETSTGRPPQPPIVLLTGPKIEIQTPVIQDERKDKSIAIAVFDCRHTPNKPPYIPPVPWKEAGFYRLDTLEGVRCLEQLLATLPAVMGGAWGSPMQYGPPPMYSHTPMMMGPMMPPQPMPMYRYPPPFMPVHPMHSNAQNALHRSNSTGSYPLGHPRHAAESRFLRRKPVGQTAPSISTPARPKRTKSYEMPRKKEVRFSSDPPQEYRYPHDDDGDNFGYDDGNMLDEGVHWEDQEEDDGFKMAEPIDGYHAGYAGHVPILPPAASYEHTTPTNRISDLIRRISSSSSSRRQPSLDRASPQRPRARLNHAEV